METVTVADRDEFLAMAEAHFRELNPAFYPQQDWKLGFFHAAKHRAKWIQHEGKRVGFIIYGIKPDPIMPRVHGAIHELYIVPEFRRKGLAKQAAIAAIEELEKGHPHKIEIEIMDGNDGALALWQSLGFGKVSDRWVLPRI